ncbi:MAG: hypothetical protein COC12_08540 [Rhodobacteraceae bacterium]|nr:MAG: hypothetical protein COC12_08540 [Paracoccaceae bacterium]
MTLFDQLLGEIENFRAVAFDRDIKPIPKRKKAMTNAARRCGDDHIRGLLAASVDDISQNPQHVRSAISKAQGHVETLKYNRPDLA